MSEKQYDRRLLPYLTALGLVSTTYAELEFSINDAIWELANITRSAGVCMTAQMIGPAPRNRCLLALLKFRGASEQLLSEFNKLGKNIESVAARRNRYVHDPMTIDHATGKVDRMEATADKHIRYGFMPTEVQHLEQLAHDIDIVTDAFADLYLRALDELPTWPRTQFSQSEGIRVHRIKRKNDG
jgi:hypothetical protein